MFNYTNCLFVLLILFSTSAFSDVHKWKDADGKTHYGDAPHMAGTIKVRTDEQTDDQIANGERIKTETGNSTRHDAIDEARSSGKCKFEYFLYGDDKGMKLALAAQEECLSNEAIKSTGHSSMVSLDAYNAWKDHRASGRSGRWKGHRASGRSGRMTLCPNGSYVSSGPCTICPDGSFIGGGERCVITPIGTYVGGGKSGNERPRIAPNGSYVSGGGHMTLCPDGSYVTGRSCRITPTGGYVGK